MNYMKTTLLFALMQIKRLVREPLSIIILLGLPVVLLIVFGFVVSGSSSISLRTVVINQSDHSFAGEIVQTLEDIDVLRHQEESLSLTEATDKLSRSELDTVIVLPEGFGESNELGQPSGAVEVYYASSSQQTNEIVSSIMRSVIERYNHEIVGVEMPLSIEQKSIDGEDAQGIQQIFSIFAGMGLLMIGVFGIGAGLPADKKARILRRLHVTPLRASQVNIGTVLAYSAFSAGVILVMTLIAMLGFDMNINGHILSFIGFIVLSLLLMVGIGFAVAGISKTTGQAEGIGQVIFLGSLALSGVWFPIAMLPEVLQGIVSFLPLTPVIEGIRAILIEGAAITDLGSQLLVIGIWIAVTYLISFKTFSWE